MTTYNLDDDAYFGSAEETADLEAARIARAAKTLRTEKFMLPEHWASHFVNGDLDGYSDRDLVAMEKFTNYMVGVYGACWCLDVAIDFGDDFRGFHDATEFGVLACNVVEFTFDITDRHAVA
jgi:hypothetical protein